MSKIIDPFSTTGIGSLPFKNPEEACSLILRTFDIPFWPQLPRRSFLESMIIQYTEGMPYIRISETEQSAWIVRDGSDELERFYESYSDNTKIAVSEDYAMGLHVFLRLIRGKRFKTLKGHITGPITFTLGLKDNFGRLLFFDEELREISSMLLKAKVRWQIDLLKQHSEHVIIFIDEPILSAIGGSSYLGVDYTEVLRLLTDMVYTIKNSGAIAGIHCCGRADWPMVIKSNAQIISFDAYEYFDTLVIYHQEIKSFLQNGGYLAWGIVPTSDAIKSVDDRHLVGLMDKSLNELYKYISPQIVRSQILITPSCGLASRTIYEAVKVLQLLVRLKEEMA